MWKKIERRSEVIALKKGMHLTQDPETAVDIFEISGIDNEASYVSLFHANGKIELKFLPAEELLKRNWWSKEPKNP